MAGAARGQGEPGHHQADQRHLLLAVGGGHRHPFAAARSIAHWGWDNRHYIYGEITLSGGDVSKLTLRAFVNAAYALMVRTYAGIPGKNLLEAIELANESFGLETRSKEEDIGAKNAAALNQLDAMMAGVQR